MLKRAQGPLLSKPTVSGALSTEVTHICLEADCDITGKVQAADIKRREAYKASMISSSYAARVICALLTSIILFLCLFDPDFLV